MVGIIKHALIGIDRGYIGAVTRVGECHGPETFVPFCDRDPESSFVHCSRLACEAAGVDTVEVSIAQGDTPQYRKRRPLQYEATTGAGTVGYDPFPTVLWRTVETAAGSYGISAHLFRRLTVTPSGDRPIDLTHAGAVSVKVVKGEVSSLECDLAFPTLASGARQITVDASLDAAGRVRGTVRRGTETLAKLAGEFQVAFTWVDGCTD